MVGNVGVPSGMGSPRWAKGTKRGISSASSALIFNFFGTSAIGLAWDLALELGLKISGQRVKGLLAHIDFLRAAPCVCDISRSLNQPGGFEVGHHGARAEISPRASEPLPPGGHVRKPYGPREEQDD